MRKLPEWEEPTMSDLIGIVLHLSKELLRMKILAGQIRKIRTDPFASMWMGPEMVMDLLNIGRRTLRELRSNGTLPFTRIQGKIYYKTNDIVSLMESNYIHKKKK